MEQKRRFDTYFTKLTTLHAHPLARVMKVDTLISDSLFCYKFVSDLYIKLFLL